MQPEKMNKKYFKLLPQQCDQKVEKIKKLCIKEQHFEIFQFP